MAITALIKEFCGEVPHIHVLINKPRMLDSTGLVPTKQPCVSGDNKRLSQGLRTRDRNASGPGAVSPNCQGGLMLELYHAHPSTCSQKVRLCLAEKGLEFTSRPVN